MITRRVLIVEDEPIVAEDLQNRLREMNYEIAGLATSAREAVQLAVETNPDVVLMDIVLEGGSDGIEAALQIRRQLEIPVVFLTAHSDERTLSRAKATEPYGYLLKPFEPSTLSMALDMAPRRMRVERELQGISRWFNDALNSAGDGVIATNREGRILFLNPVAESLTGCLAQDVVHQPVDRVLRLLDPHSRSVTADPVLRVMQSGQIVRLNQPMLIIRPDGAESLVEDSAAPIRDESGEMIGVILIIRPVAEMGGAVAPESEPSAPVESQTGAGALSPEERQLAVLASSISDHLRRPIMTIDGSARWLSQHFGEKLGVTGHRFLENIQRSAVHMREMLEVFLNLLDASRAELAPFALVDMEAEARAVFHQLTRHRPELKPEWVVHPAPMSCGNSALLRQVLVHLLTNAIKFSSKSIKPRVEFGGRITQSGQEFYIKDNGVGFDPAATAGMFEAFRRFHQQSEYPGLGVGLATAKHILERHGGRLWTESTPGQGAVFSFSLPHRSLADPNN